MGGGGGVDSRHPNIKFSMNMERDQSLPTLSFLVSKYLDSSLVEAVYREPTHRDRYWRRQAFNKMTSHFQSTRDTQPLTQKSWVYKIPCSYGKVCVGPVGCHVFTRILGTHQKHQTGEPVISTSWTSCTDKTQHWLWQVRGHSQHLDLPCLHHQGSHQNKLGFTSSHPNHHRTIN
jgi:hypothetical protein